MWDVSIIRGQYLSFKIDLSNSNFFNRSNNSGNMLHVASSNGDGQYYFNQPVHIV